MVKIKIPGSTSNLGPGFDSIGMAVNRYLYLDVQLSETTSITHEGDMLKDVIDNDSHYLRKYLNYFYNYFKDRGIINYQLNFKIHMSSEIPLARGLGSSASCLIASLEIINYFYDLKLTTQDKLLFLTQIEGHPDNVAPSLFGGITISHYDGKKVDTVVAPGIEWPMYTFVPNFELKTSVARNVLPSQLPYQEAVDASAISNVLVASLFAKDYETLGRKMMSDKLHEPYRHALLPHYESIKFAIKGLGYCFLSGAGPTIFIMLKPDKVQEALKYIDNLQLDGTLSKIESDNIGTTVTV
ncbi:homoserine kinase [Macrococcus sp. DPC7161]|uniref:homoserine kinase n=1 Tax=Macrococcus sp. DPC7161 TaxID=2507060 RepID=UPI00100B5BE7|nr:homoserine kinase [Macrococcus sp. DPC7161]RXK19110.1 homoserine kinase [Macrococcus sp. DPC7161]